MAELGNFTAVFQLGCGLNGLMYVYTLRPHLEKRMTELFQQEEMVLQNAREYGIGPKFGRTEKEFIMKVDKGWDLMNRVISFMMSILSMMWLIYVGFHPDEEAPWYKLVFLMLGLLFLSPMFALMQHRSYKKGIQGEIKFLEREIQAKLAIRRGRLLDKERKFARLQSARRRLAKELIL